MYKVCLDSHLTSVIVKQWRNVQWVPAKWILMAEVSGFIEIDGDIDYRSEKAT